MIDFDKDTVYLEDPVFKIWYKRNNSSTKQINVMSWEKIKDRISYRPWRHVLHGTELNVIRHPLGCLITFVIGDGNI